MDGNIATVDANMQSFKDGNLTATDYAQQPRIKTLRYCSVYNEKILIGLFVEVVNR